MTYGWAVEMVTRGAVLGYRVREVPVSYHPRIGVSKNQRNVEGLGRRRVVHSHRHREEPAALFDGTGNVNAGPMDRDRGAVVVMAKAPREGSVKTRLNCAYPARDVVELSSAFSTTR